MKKSLALSFMFLEVCGPGVRIEAGGMLEDVDVEGVDLTEDTRVRVLNQDLLLKEGTPALFYIQVEIKTDFLYRGTIVEDTVFTIRGHELTVDADNVVWFYESGNLKYTTAISKPTVFQVQGKEVLYAWLAEDAVIMIQGKPIKVPADKSISFYGNGVVKECGFLKKDTAFRIQNQMVLFTSYRTLASGITFYDNGNVIYGSLAEDTAFTIKGNKVWLKGRNTVRFYKSGALADGRLVENTVFDIQNKQILFKAGKGLYVEFSESGVLQKGFLGESTELIYNDQLITITESSYVEFNGQGTLVSFNTDTY